MAYDRRVGHGWTTVDIRTDASKPPRGHSRFYIVAYYQYPETIRDLGYFSALFCGATVPRLVLTPVLVVRERTTMLNGTIAQMHVKYVTR